MLATLLKKDPITSVPELAYCRPSRKQMFFNIVTHKIHRKAPVSVSLFK